MSTRVYTGFKFVARELRDIVTAMEGIKASIEKLQREGFLKVYACMLVTLLDRSQAAVAAGNSEQLVQGMAGRRVRDAIYKRQAQVRTTRERDPAVDFEVVLACWYSRKLGEVIGYVYGELSETVLTMLKETGVATEYGYWNNTDRPESVSAREWRMRGKVWDEVLDGKSGQGFQFRYDGEMANMPFKWDELQAHLPSIESRAREQAEANLLARWSDAPPVKPDDWSAAWQRYTEFRRQLRRDPAMQDALATEIERLKPLLLTGESLNAARKTPQLLISESDD
ncbi:hypothetical protein [Burkholderia ambifaria]|uniref:hypothetical protein n=1 Tax=Burkholderia ambifaria TaxID=152480 RepID=UPI000F808AC0|nr:hypothetical protein [Burkholderia ambifaria]